jgi:hypothetical protein
MSALPPKADIRQLSPRPRKQSLVATCCLMTHWRVSTEPFFGKLLVLFGTRLRRFFRPPLEHLSNLASSFAANAVTFTFQICERSVSQICKFCAFSLAGNRAIAIHHSTPSNKPSRVRISTSVSFGSSTGAKITTTSCKIATSSMLRWNSRANTTT